MPLWVVLLAVAVTPAVCEELFFRGVVLSGLRSLGKWPAIAISALLFAVAHASIYRLLPTLLLGLVLGYLVWKTGSIVVSMIVHALNNGIVAVLSQTPSVAAALGFDATAKVVPLGPTLIAAAVSGLALALVASQTPRARHARGPPPQVRRPPCHTRTPWIIRRASEAARSRARGTRGTRAVRCPTGSTAPGRTHSTPATRRRSQARAAWRPARRGAAQWGRRQCPPGTAGCPRSTRPSPCSCSGPG